MKEVLQYTLYKLTPHMLLPEKHDRVIRYHSVGGSNYANISTERFRADVEYFKKHYELVDLPDVLENRDSKQLALTFDDGYLDFKENVVPVIDEFDIPATVFVVTDPVFRPNKSAKGTNISDFCIHMGRADIEAIIDNERIHIGNHTKSHPQLTQCSDEELLDEIVNAKIELEEEFDIVVDRFCYPHGDFNDTVVSIVRDTHKYAVKASGANEIISGDTDPAQIPRVDGANEQWKTRWQVSDSYLYLRSLHQKLP